MPIGLDAGANEFDVGELGTIEKFGTLEVAIALFIAGVQRIYVDGSLYFGGLRVIRVKSHGSGYLREFSFHITNHQMAHREVGAGVSCVDIVNNSCHEISCSFPLDTRKPFELHNSYVAGRTFPRHSPS